MEIKSMIVTNFKFYIYFNTKKNDSIFIMFYRLNSEN